MLQFDTDANVDARVNGHLVAAAVNDHVTFDFRCLCCRTRQFCGFALGPISFNFMWFSAKMVEDYF